MAKDVVYRQCRLRRGNCHQTSWLPEKFAAVGKVLRLRNAAHWEEGWLVEEVGSHRLPESQLPDWHREIKGHRKATGDSLPRSE
jgi:hypothetical protein